MKPSRAMRLWGAMVLAMVLALAAGCGGDPEEELPDTHTAEHHDELYVKSSKIWSGDIPVCWENAGNRGTERSWVREAVARGAHAVIGVNLDYTPLGDCLIVTATGTAVTLRTTR